MSAHDVLVLALDGATFDVIGPLAEAGRLPNLAAWMREGDARPLRSTVPPMTFPAWSSFLTGLGPGRHGLFDFTQKVPGKWRVRFSSAADRCGASLFARASRAGRSVLALGMPAMFPPEPLDGLLVPGFDAPVSSGSDPRSASDPALYARVAARAGPWMRPDLDESARDGGFHERAVETLLARVDRKAEFAREALSVLRERDGRRPALAVVVFAESDTVGHHYWRDHDPRSPRHDPDASARRKGAVAAVYQRLDAACGALREAYGEDAACVVVSDHGMGGAGRRVVHLNRRLSECGLLRRAAGPAALDRLARGARDTALRALPPRAAQAVFRRVRGAAARVESAARFGGCDWRHTFAVSEEANTQPGVWINLRGRERGGCVDPADYQRVRSDVIAALGDWKLPGGDPVVAWARPREDVYTGPCVERAPDVVLELAQDAGYGLSLVPSDWRDLRGPSVRTLQPDELSGGRGRGMNGTHRSEGIWIAAGAARGRAALAPEIVDAAPTLLDLLGVPWDGDLDGHALGGRGYSAREEARVADRLRALGYLE